MDSKTIPSSSSWKYDVFLSFNPEDTSYDFASHLYFNLLRNEVKTLVHKDKKQQEYSSIPKTLKEDIEKCGICIVVFSRNYAASTSRLEELSKIAECIDSVEHKHTAFPVFYDLNPSMVRQQEKWVYEKVFGEYEEIFKPNLQKVERWRKAITKVANLDSAWVVEKETQRTQVMYELVRRAMKEMGIKGSTSVMDETGIQLQLEAFKNLLHKGSDHDYRKRCNNLILQKEKRWRNAVYTKLGTNLQPAWLVDQKKNRIRTHVIYDIVISAKNILGIKTSSAMDEFELVGIQPHLEALQNLVDLASNNDVVGVIGICGMRGSGKTTLASLLYNRISHKFDAFCYVANVRLVSAIPNGVSYLPQQILSQILQEEDLKISGVEQGSSIIATRLRNLKILLVLDDVRDMQMLKVLLRIRDWFGVGSRIIVTSRDEHILKSYGVDQIYKVGQLSKEEAFQRFESLLLNHMQKEIFLDIACFFVGEKINNVIEILSDCNPGHEIEALIRNSSLITISDDEKIEMHYMLQELGHKVVQQEFPNEPGMRSRLWFDDDFRHVIETNNGTRNITALVLNPKVPEEKPLRVDGLSKMDGLKLLIIRNVNFSGDLKGLSKRLRYVWWHRFPFTCLPSSFEPNNLVQLIIPDSNITQLWKESKTLPNLRNLDLHGSKNLMETPHFERLPKLEKLNVEGCIALVVLDPSITFLTNLKFLNLRNCTTLVSLPNNLFNLSSLEVLNLAGCSKFAECLDFDDNWTSSTEGDEEVLSNQDLPLVEEIGKQLVAGGKSIEGTSSTITADKYPTSKCIVALDEFEGVSDKSYVKALENFQDPYWREAFLTMSDKGKKVWLNNLV